MMTITKAYLTKFKDQSVKTGKSDRNENLTFYKQSCLLKGPQGGKSKKWSMLGVNGTQAEPIMTTLELENVKLVLNNYKDRTGAYKNDFILKSFSSAKVGEPTYKTEQVEYQPKEKTNTVDVEKAFNEHIEDNTTENQKEMVEGKEE